MFFEVLFVLVYVIYAAVALWSLGQVRSFLAQTPTIADARSLERFKALARAQMYLALFVIAALGAGMILGLVLITRHGLLALAVVLVVNALVFGFAMYFKTFEAKARNLRAGSEALEREYRQVSQTWMKRPFPNF